MADLKNCSQCGRLFAGQGELCRRCQETEEDEFLTVRRYIRDHPGSSVFEVSEATGVEESKILSFLRRGRLEARGMVADLECERCGKRISSGRYCRKCLEELERELGKIVSSNKNVGNKSVFDKKGKMFIKDKDVYKE
ncbi:MAG: MerR family transcriptional regulator [Syntrophomonadaceae bacterium]|nr:MerR family transcriptional regulator [Syntrophomonadaceae bacterium]